MTLRRLTFILLLVMASGFRQRAAATSVGFGFNASLKTGALAGTSFTGTGSYDNKGEQGVGTEYLSLSSLNFSLLEFPFTLKEVDQGGQAVLQNGVLFDFTAAFLAPSTAPVDNLAFGFGGPGVIGYSTPPGFNAGSGTYQIVSSVTPEPSAWLLCALGFSAAPLLRNRLQRWLRSPLI